MAHGCGTKEGRSLWVEELEVEVLFGKLLFEIGIFRVDRGDLSDQAPPLILFDGALVHETTRQRPEVLAGMFVLEHVPYCQYPTRRNLSESDDERKKEVV